jgi:hypothetical protein
VTQLEHAESIEPHDTSGEAELLRAAARMVFERLGARPWLERLGEPQARVPT